MTPDAAEDQIAVLRIGWGHAGEDMVLPEILLQRNAEKRNYEHIEAEMRQLQGRIVAEMGRSCTAVCQGREAAYSISYKPVRKSGISKDNLQRLQAQHPDIYEQYVTVSESRRFYVKKQREEAA